MNLKPFGQARAIGIDIGTSGARAVAVDRDGRPVAASESAYKSSSDTRTPAAWWTGVENCISGLSGKCALGGIEGLAVDGTSGTLVALDAGNAPLGAASLYNDSCDDPAIIAAIAAAAPATSPALGATTALGRAIQLSRRSGVHLIVHQADWIAMRLGHGEAISDENNALKTGYDLVTECWPDWLESAGMNRRLLPRVVRAGALIGSVGKAGRAVGLATDTRIHAGTTDGCASFLATGANQVGDAVTSLGSTLVVKIASDRPINAPQFGIYSHRVGNLWLAGGASNTGGAVIRSLFGDAQLDELTRKIDASHPTGLDYYPLLKPGERFPINDPHYAPRLEPRPADDAVFFKGVLEGIAAIEELGYRQLATLGAPQPRSVRTVGGGARNLPWREIRQRKLGVPFLDSFSEDAAAGAASLALRKRNLSL
ncbi:MAG: FGGY-family carbohydrate kinase [Aestuariivirga sp.]|nr:FGGY-family carbohydrate kinase [Aestuariivirga sp.]